jgi:DNA-damage-inducible protein J
MKFMSNMSNAINMSFRVDKDLKKKADELFKSLGMNTSVALNMFLTQSVREQSIPFTPTMRVPNQKLLDAIEEVEAIESGKIEAKRYKSFEDALKDLD